MALVALSGWDSTGIRPNWTKGVTPRVEARAALAASSARVVILAAMAAAGAALGRTALGSRYDGSLQDGCLVTKIAAHSVPPSAVQTHAH